MVLPACLTRAITLCGVISLSAAPIDLAVLAEIDLGQPVAQFRAVPVELGARQPKAVAALYSSDAEIDPYIGMFFFPRSTLKLAVFDETGRVRSTRDLSTAVVPGVLVRPGVHRDLDQDGVDEIYLVGNLDPQRPLDFRQYRLEQVDAATGRTLAQKPWPEPEEAAPLSHVYRHSIVGRPRRRQAGGGGSRRYLRDDHVARVWAPD